MKKYVKNKCIRKVYTFTQGEINLLNERRDTILRIVNSDGQKLEYRRDKISNLDLKLGDVLVININNKVSFVPKEKLEEDYQEVSLSGLDCNESINPETSSNTKILSDEEVARINSNYLIEKNYTPSLATKEDIQSLEEWIDELQKDVEDFRSDFEIRLSNLERELNPKQEEESKYKPGDLVVITKINEKGFPIYSSAILVEKEGDYWQVTTKDGKIELEKEEDFKLVATTIEESESLQAKYLKEEIESLKNYILDEKGLGDDKTVLIDHPGLFGTIIKVTMCCEEGPITNENYCPDCGKKIIK